MGLRDGTEVELRDEEGIVRGFEAIVWLSGRSCQGKQGYKREVVVWPGEVSGRVYACIQESLYLCGHVQKPEEDAGAFSPYFLIPLVETGSLARLETCHFDQAGPASYHLSVLGLQAHAAQIFMWMLQTQAQMPQI